MCMTLNTVDTNYKKVSKEIIAITASLTANL